MAKKPETKSELKPEMFYRTRRESLYVYHLEAVTIQGDKVVGITAVGKPDIRPLIFDRMKKLMSRSR